MLGGRFDSATAFCTLAMPSPRLMPSKRAVTCTLRCRLSRRISVWPGISVMVASEPMVAVLPVPLTSSVLRMVSRVLRAEGGKRTRMV